MSDIMVGGLKGGVWGGSRVRPAGRVTRWEVCGWPGVYEAVEHGLRHEADELAMESLRVTASRLWCCDEVARGL